MQNISLMGKKHKISRPDIEFETEAHAHPYTNFLLESLPASHPPTVELINLPSCMGVTTTDSIKDRKH